jgi:DNA-binding NtrC family response regulator
MKGRILIVDDEDVVRDSLHRMFVDEGFGVRSAASGREGLDGLTPGVFDVALIDIRMPGMDGMELQEHLRQADPEMLVIIMTGYASVETAVQGLKNGAWDYIVKPVDPDELLHLINRAVEHRGARREVVRLRENLQEIFPKTVLVGHSPAMKRVMELVEMVAPTEATVLITG